MARHQHENNVTIEETQEIYDKLIETSTIEGLSIDFDPETGMTNFHCSYTNGDEDTLEMEL